MTPIRNFCATAGLSILAAIWVGATAQAELVDRIVATVDKEPILQSEVIAEVRPALQEASRVAKSDAEYARQAERILRQAVEQAIDAKILLREALIAGIKVEDDLVEKRIQMEREQYPSAEAFQKEVEASGMTVGELREVIRKGILVSKMAQSKRRQFEAEVEVSESDVAQYFQDRPHEFFRPDRARIRQIFLSAPSDPQGRAEIRARIEQIKGELDKGANFGELAQAHSEAPGAQDGGLVGWVARGDLVDALDEAAFTTPEGEISGILETETGFSVLKVEKREAAGQASLDEVRKEIGPKLREKAAGERFSKWLGELRKRSRVHLYL
ncbi:MAG TPA: peptidylprolyl isomerase [Candidatus Hydrogenedentes bacterium]|nr:peptidylprolyl isomerase [Candidatus Hydrogenedentota bacterium]HOS01916.1 peptidylprolyl isomerase [Candidatus Hydrogenedentota bacterium]